VGEPRRVRVEGSLYQPRIPPGAVYVGRSGPRRPASKFANPFRLKLCVGRLHPLRGYVETAVCEVTVIDRHRLAEPRYDLIAVGTPAVAVAAYRYWLGDRQGLVAAAKDELRGHDLACWCKLADPCHGDPLLAVANGWEWPRA
jgi:Domain of unknown function (DUF4326)